MRFKGLILASLLFLAACQTHEFALLQGYLPPVGARVLIEGNDPSFRQALVEALKRRDLFWQLKGRPVLLRFKVERARASWFWSLWPGKDAKTFTVELALEDGDKVVGRGFGKTVLREGAEPLSALAEALAADLQRALHPVQGE